MSGILNFLYKNFVQILLSLFCAFLLTFWQSSHEKPDLRAGDSLAYLSIAKDIVDKGVFTDGKFEGAGIANGPHGEGMFFAPLYPVFVAGAMVVDPTFYESVSCHLSENVNYQTCSQTMGVLKLIQILMETLALWLIWMIGFTLTQSYRVGWVSMLIAGISRVYGYHTADVMTENLVFPLFSAASLFSILAWQRKSKVLWGVSGVFLGLLALTRPSFPYLFYVSIPILFLFVFYVGRQSIKFALSVVLFFVTGYVLVISPWIIRNGLVLNQYALSGGYSSYILVQRVAYNQMTIKEWAYSFVYSFPDFGDKLAQKLFGQECCDRLSYSDPKGFYEIGNGELREVTLQQAGSVKNHLSFLIKSEIFPHIFKHSVVTLSLAWKGVWIQKYWGLITILLFIPAIIMAWRLRWIEFFILAFPPWFMLGFHAFTSVNVVRYNFILIPCLSVSAAYVVVWMVDKYLKRLKEEKNNHAT